MRRFLTLTLALVSFLGFATAAPAHHGVALATHCHVHTHAHAIVAPTLTLATPFQQTVSYNTAAFVAQPTVALAATYSQPALAATCSAPAPCPVPVPVPVPTPSPFQFQAPASCYGGTACYGATAGAGYAMTQAATYGQVPTYSAAVAAPAAYSYGASLGAQTGYADSVGVGAAYGNTQAVFLERSRRGVYGATLPTTTLLAAATPVYGTGIGVTTARGTSVLVPTATLSPFAGGLRGGFHLPFGHGGSRETVRVRVRSR